METFSNNEQSGMIAVTKNGEQIGEPFEDYVEAIRHMIEAGRARLVDDERAVVFSKGYELRSL